MAITHQQFNTIGDLFDYYNNELFNNELPQCLVSIARHKGAHGFFTWDRWQDKENNLIHEIALNPDTMHRADAEWHSTLVHEMCHLWQQTLGDKVRKAYHNKQFAAKMEEVGLMTSTTGAPGGKRTGQSMTHYIMDGGPFRAAFDAIEADELHNLKLPYAPARPKMAETKVTAGGSESEGDGEGGDSEPKSKSGVKVKYSCSCGYNVWGKSGLKINCDDCEESFKEAE